MVGTYALGAGDDLRAFANNQRLAGGHCEVVGKVHHRVGGPCYDVGKLERILGFSSGFWIRLRIRLRVHNRIYRVVIITRCRDYCCGK